MLLDAAPYDRMKSRCLDCGDELHTAWAHEPVDMTVFTDTVVLPLGSSQPVIFTWPGINSTEEIGSDLPSMTQSGRIVIDAASCMATEDKVLLDALYLHKSTCWLRNMTNLSDKLYQAQLFAVPFMDALEDQEKEMSRPDNMEIHPRMEIVEEVDDAQMNG